MSVSLRDRRVRIYDYSNSGGSGFPSAKYTFRAERWASVSQTGGAKAIVATAPEEKSDAVFDFDPSVDVETNDLLVDGADRYFAQTRSTQHQPPALIVKAVKISTEVFKKLDVNFTNPNALDEPVYDASVVES